MTTTVTVKTHNWPVEVVMDHSNAPSSIEVVPENSERMLYVHSTLELHIKELPPKEDK